MSTKPIIAVTGATGNQGGSVVRFLAKDNTFQIRALTRNPNSSSAQDLKSKYPTIDLIQADLNDPTSLEKAFDGAYGVFAVTNFWEHGAEGEIRHGKNMVDAAKKMGVRHFIYSTLDGIEPHVPHWISKAEVDDYLKESGVPRTSLYTGFYIENFLNPVMAPKKQEDGSYLLAVPTLPDAKTFVYPVSDTGAWVRAAFSHPEEWLNKDMRVATEWLSTRDFAEIAAKVTGKKVIPMELTEEQFLQTKNADYPGAEEFYLNFLFFITHGPDSGIRDSQMTWKVYPQATTWEQFVKDNADVLFP